MLATFLSLLRMSFSSNKFLECHNFTPADDLSGSWNNLNISDLFWPFVPWTGRYSSLLTWNIHFQ